MWERVHYNQNLPHIKPLNMSDQENQEASLQDVGQTNSWTVQDTTYERESCTNGRSTTRHCTYCCSNNWAAIKEIQISEWLCPVLSFITFTLSHSIVLFGEWYLNIMIWASRTMFIARMTFFCFEYSNANRRLRVWGLSKELQVCYNSMLFEIYM